MLLPLVKFVGCCLARTPEPLLRLVSESLGRLTYHGMRGRRRVMLHSLACSFPERSEAWRRRTALLSCIRLFETALLSLAAPYFSEDRVLRTAFAGEGLREYFAELHRNPRPLFIGTTHLAYWEGLTWIKPLLRPVEAPEIVAVFRPLRNPRLDAWVKQTRERFGVSLLSRRKGLHASLHALQRKGAVSILFDQSAGSHGYLTIFLGRECSTTPLPGLLVEKTGADACIVYTRRLGFWRFEIRVLPVETDRTPEGVTVALNRAFEGLLRGDEVLCSSWLWLHQRWRILDRPEEKEKLEARRGGLIG